MFGYEYVKLTPDQLEARRKLLEQAGLYAYLTPVVLLFTIYTGRRVLSWMSNAPSSKGPQATSPIRLFSRRVHWLLTNTYIPEFGPFHVQLAGAAYAIYLLCLIVRNTGNDYMHVTKAFGHVAVSQLPFHYLLAIKDPRSPITLATGLTHERLNNYHRLFGRIIHALLATHAILYLKFFVDMNVIAKRVGDWDVRYGLMAFWSMNFLGLLAIPPIRKAVYHKVFYRSHVVLSAVLLLVLWLHVPYTRTYVAQAGTAWIYNALRRAASSDDTDFSCREISSGLIEVTARLVSTDWETWVPGMHGYLKQKGLGPKNPFTVVSVKKTHDKHVEVKFIVRDLGGPMTSLLSKEADGKKKTKLQIEGPYGESKLYLPRILHDEAGAGRVLAVAGGVGATYALPIYMALLKAWPGRGNRVRLVWIVRDVNDAKWGLDVLRDAGGPVNVILFVTGSDKKMGLDAKVDRDLEGLQVLSSGARPDMANIVDDFFGLDGKSEAPGNGSDKITVMVCGPPGLSQSLRKAVGERVNRHTQEVTWYEEQFGFGGS